MENPNRRSNKHLFESKIELNSAAITAIHDPNCPMYAPPISHTDHEIKEFYNNVTVAPNNNNKYLIF